MGKASKVREMQSHECEASVCAVPQVALLDAPPAAMRRPLALVEGRAYAATWLYVRITRTETLGPDGEVVVHDPPLQETGLCRLIVRDDGVLFGDGEVRPEGVRPLEALGLEVVLPEVPRASRLWSASGVQAYRAGRCPEPVEVFTRITDVVSRFVDFDRSLADQRTMAEMVACYVLMTWFLEAFNVTGYLWPTGERGSGKTVLLHTVAEMAYLGQVLLAGGTYASLRDLAEYGATLAFDDAENLSDLRKAGPDKRALLLAGNRRGSSVTMKVRGRDKAQRTRHVNAFCPRLFSAIQLPDNVLASRSIVIPLVRTPDRQRANADPLDAEAWPHDRRALIDDLWALALRHLPELRRYEKRVSDEAALTGRALEPWRAILAISLWLDAQDAEGVLVRQDASVQDGEGEAMALWPRMHGLSRSYQGERVELESDNINTLVVQALYAYVIYDISIINGFTNAMRKNIPITSANRVPAQARKIDWDSPDLEVPEEYVVTTEEVVLYATVFARQAGHKESSLTPQRVGRVLGHMRLERAPRPGGQGSRRWRVTLADLARWMAAYGLSLPKPLRKWV